MDKPVPKYQFWCGSILVAAVPLDTPPAVGELFTVIGREDATAVPGRYQVAAPLSRCIDPARYESLIRKVTVLCISDAAKVRDGRAAMDRMIAWERAAP